MAENGASKSLPRRSPEGFLTDPSADVPAVILIDQLKEIFWLSRQGAA